MSLAKPLQCDHGLRRQRIVQSLLADVFQGRLHAGRHLVTQELADRFGVSHTPIREALITLAGMGIVDLLPNRGAVVRQVTDRDVREICAVRRALECLAARSACGRIDLAELQRLAQGFKRLMAVRSPAGPRFVDKARAMDSRLHDLVAGSCGNAFLAKELSRLKILFRAFRDISWEQAEARNDYRRIAAEAREHLAIVQALEAGDALQAARAMSQHIRAGARYWSRAVPAGHTANGANGPPRSLGPAQRRRTGRNGQTRHGDRRSAHRNHRPARAGRSARRPRR
jgi:DNA-binding GntR family transcriptional regulator